MIDQNVAIMKVPVPNCLGVYIPQAVADSMPDVQGNFRRDSLAGAILQHTMKTRCQELHDLRAGKQDERLDKKKLAN